MGVARSELWAPDLQNTNYEKQVHEVPTCFYNDSNRERNLSSVLLILSHEGKTDKLTQNGGGGLF